SCPMLAMFSMRSPGESPPSVTCSNALAGTAIPHVSGAPVQSQTREPSASAAAGVLSQLAASSVRPGGRFRMIIDKSSEVRAMKAHWGTAVKVLRIARDWSQHDLAAAAEFTGSAISRFEGRGPGGESAAARARLLVASMGFPPSMLDRALSF